MTKRSDVMEYDPPIAELSTSEKIAILKSSGWLAEKLASERPEAFERFKEVIDE